MPEEDIAEQDLPGIGRRYDLRDETNAALAVIVHHTGRREVYRQLPDGEMEPVLTLSDDQARRIGAILGGAYFTPSVVSEIQAVVGGLLIDWVTLRPDSPAVGRTIADLEVRGRTGMTIAAVLREGVPIIAPGPDEHLQAEDRLVVVGDPADFVHFTRTIVG